MKILRFFNNWVSSLKTFPLTHVLLLAITVLCIGRTAWGWSDLQRMSNLVISLGLVCLMSLYGPLLSLHYKDSVYKKMSFWNIGLQVLSVLLGVGYYFLLPDLPEYSLVYAENIFYFGIFPLVIIGIFLLIARLSKKDQDGIRLAWGIILKAIIFGGLAGLIIYGGLSGALASIEALFDVDLSWHWYSYFGYVSMILLTGSFILNYYLVETENTPIIQKSRMRKVFGCYIILPLALIYLLIFLAYGLKILITGVWPKGVIVWLGTGYFALGMVSYFLTYPEKIRAYEIIHKILFGSFLFVAVMMVCAIVKRINQYGITINRYFVCMLIAGIILFSLLALGMKRRVWLSFASIVFVLSLVSFYGPLNADKVSLGFQYKRLSRLLASENIAMPLGANALENLTGDNARNIASLIDEVVENNAVSERGDRVISLDSIENIDELSKWGLRNKVHEVLSLKYDYDFSEHEYFSFRCSMRNQGVDIAGYSKIYSISLYKDEDYVLPKELGGNLDISNYVEAIYEKSKADGSKDSDNIQPYIIDEGDKRYVITSSNGEKKSDGSLVINGIQGYVLLK